MSLGYKKTLSRNKGSSRPSNILFYDVESHVSQPEDGKRYFTPFLWTAILATYRKQADQWSCERLSGTTINDFWSIIDRFPFNKRALYMVSHHLEADFIPLDGINQLMDRGFILTKPIQNGRTVLYYWNRDNDKIVVMNNGNIFDGSIEQWGKLLGLPKLDMPSDNDPFDDWVTYCARDTEIMYAMWQHIYQFMDLHELGNFKLTKAGLAFSAFRHRFMEPAIQIHDHTPTLALERQGYRGGRFQALQYGDFEHDTYYQLDYNSMYAAIMIEQELPYQLIGYSDNSSLIQVKSKLVGYDVIAEVEVDQKEPVFPHTEDGKTVYRAGRFKTALSTPELIYAFDQGWIKKAYQFAWYAKAPVLKAYAEYFTQLKIKYEQENNPGMRALTKIFPNAVYGKFAQKDHQLEEIGECDPRIVEFIDGYDADTKQYYQILCYGGHAYKATTGIVAPNGFIAIAAAITAYARMRLWTAMQSAGLDNVYHVATDSLIVNQDGYDRLKNMLDPYKIGFLKLEGTADSLRIRDVNDLDFGSSRKIKGVNRKALQLADNTYMTTQWPSIKTIIKSGDYSQYFIRDIVKTLSRPNYTPQ